MLSRENAGNGFEVIKEDGTIFVQKESFKIPLEEFEKFITPSGSIIVDYEGAFIMVPRDIVNCIIEISQVLKDE